LRCPRVEARLERSTRAFAQRCRALACLLVTDACGSNAATATLFRYADANNADAGENSPFAAGRIVHVGVPEPLTQSFFVFADGIPVQETRASVHAKVSFLHAANLHAAGAKPGAARANPVLHGNCAVQDTQASNAHEKVRMHGAGGCVPLAEGFFAYEAGGIQDDANGVQDETNCVHDDGSRIVFAAGVAICCGSANEGDRCLRALHGNNIVDRFFILMERRCALQFASIARQLHPRTMPQPCVFNVHGHRREDRDRRDSMVDLRRDHQAFRFPATSRYTSQPF
jgi:hypothetical protein